ncbi:MAG: O-mycaminosyltylonolide 6-deoxyallosyltransferase [Opitutia bacterium UBA7350]|nr:MAG: O-mycaminosyltylonolide 6-deoxyallosyltransferase [Opitutae bacterium UBA7350]
MKVLLISQGSTGDIYPLIALGKALQEAKHSVAFATAPLYKEEIEKADIPYQYTPPDWEKPVFVDCMRALDRQPNAIALMKQIYRSGLSFMGELIDTIEDLIKDYDLVVCSYIFPHFKVLSDRHKIPFVTITFCHSVIPAKDITPELVPKLHGFPAPIKYLWNSLWWLLINRIVDHSVNSIAGPVFESRGIPPIKNFITAPADLSIVCVSSSLMQKSRFKNQRFVYTGYLRWQSDTNEALEEELRQFCEAGPVPIITFGSVSFDHIQDIMSRFEKNWPKGQKIILQSGWAGLSIQINRPDIKIINQVSHDQLFKHAVCVIHHGGAGTTASVLHAGVPHIVVPHLGDQNFWASEVKRLGTGIRLSKKHWPERLYKAVQKVTSDAQYNKRAQYCADQLSQETGSLNAVATLESFMENR